MQTKMHFSAGKTRSVFSEQIRIDKKIHISAFVSAGFLFVFFAMAVFPVVNSFSGAEAAAVISETTLAMTTSDINLPFSITNPNGSFVAGDPADFTVTTNNYSGYTLSVSAKTDDENYSKLVNGSNEFNSISSATDATGFNNGNWGYLPSKLNSSANTSYQPAPTFAGDTLDVTAAANNEANTYSIALGAKADYSLPSGKYSNTFVVTAIANPVGYAISYSANTEDQTVAGIPSTQVGDITTTSVELSSDSPTRTGYEFNDWCDGTVTATMGVDSCTGTVYAPGDTYDMDQTGANVLTLKAMWNRKYTITFDANTGTGTMPDQVITGSYSLLDENLFTKDGYDFDGWNTEADGNGTGYTDMDDFNVPATGTGTTLYAQWRIVVTFEQAYNNASKSKVLNTKDNKEYYTLQDMNANICSAVSTSTKTDYSDTQEIQVMDTRDEKVYWIAKLADGRCWMTQNLALDLSTTKKLTHADTDLGWTTLNTNAEWTPERDTITFNSSTTTTVSGWTDSYTDPYSADPGIQYIVSSGTTSNDAVFYTLETCMNNNTPDITTDDRTASECSHYHTGNYYNWTAAIASNDSTAISTQYDVAPDSICPAGWRLSQGLTAETKTEEVASEWDKLLVAQGITSRLGQTYDSPGYNADGFKNIRHTPLFLVRAGSVSSDGLRYRAGDGNYWSSSVFSSYYAYDLGFNSSSAYPSCYHYREDGFAARCVARNGEEPGTFNRVFADANKTKATANDGKQYYKMQDMTSSICGAITTGQTGTLVDIRDGGTYQVGKLQDNKCWLLDNLALDLTNTDVKNAMYDSSDSTHDTMTNATNTQLGYLFNGGRDSEDATTNNLPTAGVANWTSSYSYSAPLVNMTNKDVVPQGSSDPLKDLALTESWKVGGYYNFCAASAGSYCYGNGTNQGSPSGNATADICPSGWRMPTGGASGEYQALANAITGGTSDFINTEPEYSNIRKALSLPLSGNFYDGSAYSQGSYGYFWSSAYGSSYGMYYLLVRTSNIRPQGVFNHFYGSSVRCIAQ